MSLNARLFCDAAWDRDARKYVSKRSISDRCDVVWQRQAPESVL